MKFHAWLAAFLIPLGLTTSARAMSIHDFGKMNDDDEATYVAMLVEGASHYFKAQGQPDQAGKVIAFFKTPGRAGGTYQFADALKAAFAANLKHQDNPNNRIPDLQVEDAMAATLKAEGLSVPANYLRGAGQGYRGDGAYRTITPSVNHP